MGIGLLLRKWGSFEGFDLLLGHLRGRVRVGCNQNMEPSVGIIDSQSVKWANNRSLNGMETRK